MSSLRKFKRAKAADKRKAIRKAAETECQKQREQQMMEKLGEKVTNKRAKAAFKTVYKNWNRIEAYVHAYHWPMMLKVLREKFSFGYHRMQKLDATMQLLVEKISEDDKAGQKRHVKASMIADIRRRGVAWTQRKPKTEGYGESYAVYVSLFATNLANDMLDMFEVIWLQALSIAFNFGKSRLDKALNALRAVIRKHPGERAMRNMREKLEAECYVLKEDGSVSHVDMSVCERLLAVTADKKCQFVVKAKDFNRGLEAAA